LSIEFRRIGSAVIAEQWPQFSAARGSARRPVTRHHREQGAARMQASNELSTENGRGRKLCLGTAALGL